MAIPVGQFVTINDFQARGCVNTQGRVMKSCAELCCDSVGTEFVCEKYLVRYTVENCYQCEVTETWFCEFELTAIPKA